MARRRVGISASLGAFLLSAGLAGCAVPDGPNGLTRWEDEAVQQQEAALLAAPERVHDVALDQRLERMLCRLDADACGAVRIILLDAPGLRAELIGARILRLHRPLLDAAGDDDALAFVLAHELAHRRLGHVGTRRGLRWNADAAEIAADALARQTTVAAGYRDTALATLLRLRDAGRFVDDGLERRIAALRDAMPDATCAGACAADDNRR